MTKVYADDFVLNISNLICAGKICTFINDSLQMQKNNKAEYYTMDACRRSLSTAVFKESKKNSK